MSEKNEIDQSNQLPLTLRMVLDVTYTTNQVAESALKMRLQAISSDAYANGQFTGGTEAEVDTLSATIIDLAEHSSVFSYLDVSPAHISQSTSQFLEAVSGSNSLGQTVATYEYGYFVSVPPEAEYHETLPNDLRVVLNLARKKGCSILRIDSDGEKHDELPVFDW